MSRLSDDELDDIRARNPVAAVAGQYVKLRSAGGRLVGPCPICGGGASSGRFRVFDDESWGCAVCPDGGDVIRLVEKVEGCDFRAAIERLGGRTAIDPVHAQKMFEAREAKRIAREKEADRYREAERKRLWKMWDGAGDIHETYGERYLAGRGLRLPEACPGLRYLDRAPYWHGEQLDDQGRKSPVSLHTGPAMLGAFIRADGKFGGLHITWLAGTEDGFIVKKELADPATGEVLPSKKMRGSKAGAHIAVARKADPRRLIVGEGIETVLAVYTAHIHTGRAIADTAFWAAGDLGNMAGRAIENVAHPVAVRPDGRAVRVPGPYPDPDDAGLSIPDSVEDLVLLGDGDSEPVLTQYAMERAARRYARAGREIRIAFAPAGRDFNDVLRGEG